MDPKQIARLHFRGLAEGDLALIRRIVALDHVNRMAADEPPACALPGPAGFAATGAWLRSAFRDLHWEDINYLTEGEWVVAHVKMRGVQHGPLVFFPPNKSAQVFPPTNRAVDVPQTHFFRMRGGLSVEHVAVRDDLGMMLQLGFIPPSPAVIARLAFWQVFGRSARSAAQAISIAHAAADAASRALEGTQA